MYYNKCKLLKVENNIPSACSGDNLLHFSSYESTETEKCFSEGTEVGGALN